MMKPETAAALDSVSAALIANPDFEAKAGAPRFTYVFECFDKDGNLKWSETVHNVVTTAGKNDLIDKYFKGSSYTAAWYLGLKGTGTPVAADTASSHASWTEDQNYGAATRPAITFGTTSAGSNTATAVSYSMNATTTIYGAFVISNSTKGGTTGTLYSAGDFASSRAVVSGDTLNVTLTVTIS